MLLCRLKDTAQALLCKQYFLYTVERLMIVYKALYELVQLYFYQKVFCHNSSGPQILHALMG